MERGRKIGMLIGGLVVSLAAILAIIFGVVGIGPTVSAGTHTRVCGTQIGVTVSGDGSSDYSVRLLGTDAGSLAEGDKARLGTFCVVEVVSIDTSGVEPEQDGGGARVQLKWRLW